MFVSETLWAIIGIGIILLGIAIVYGMMRNRKETAEEHRLSEEATRRNYKEEAR